MKKIIFAVLALTGTAFAENVRTLQVQSEVDGDKVAYLGVSLSDAKTITAITYERTAETPAEVYPLTTLNVDKKTIVKKGPAKVVQISTQTLSPTNVILNVHYIYKYNLIGSDKRLKQLRMYYVAPSNAVETLDMETNKVVTHAHFYVHEENGTPTGIDRIETW